MKRHAYYRPAAAGPLPVAIFCSMLIALGGSLQASAQGAVDTALDAAGVPKVAAFLPSQYDVPRLAPLPIDGVWRINTIGKKIRIEQGRAYALDPWRHLFVLQVSPGMVVMQDFRRTGPGTYAAEDLPLLGPASLTLNREGNLDVTVQGKFGPVRYQLQRLDAQYPDALTHELGIMGGSNPGSSRDRYEPPANANPILPGAGGAPQQPLPGMPGVPPAPMPAPLPAPIAAPGGTPVMPAPPAAPIDVPANCTPIGIDPDTGLPICA